MSRFLVLNIVFLILLTACSPTKRMVRPKQLSEQLQAPFYDQQFVGFELYDPSKGKSLFGFNSNKYFIPASNTKIFTLFTSLKILGDSIPALKYSKANDSLYIKGTGDPSLLHPFFKDSSVIRFLKEQSLPIALQLDNFDDTPYAAGWAWEDYDTYYAPERSALPIFGNVVSAYFAMNGLQVIPNEMKPFVKIDPRKTSRSLMKNEFYIHPSKTDTLKVPFIVNDTLVRRLLSAATQKKISLSGTKPDKSYDTLYSIPSDSLYREMMVESDNFLAEQLLILSAATLSDTLNAKKVREHVLTDLLPDLSEKPRWVDGSGLSRYNLFSPKSFVQVLNKLHKDIPRERLLSLFPVGGINGTLSDNFSAETPYIYAKSGSLGNTYNLSGYLIAKSGKTLIFSFMNNHYRQATGQIKKRMESMLKAIYEAY